MALTNKLVNIADAIRAKTGKAELMTLREMETEILDIVSSPDGSDVAFGGSDGGQVSAYAISGEILNAIVAEIQKMSGKNSPLTPEEMLYWLRRVVYIPQGHAPSTFTLNFTNAAVGALPSVQKGKASSTFTLNFTNSAIGALQEG